jgi:AcrR family transcriptional regulator
VLDEALRILLTDGAHSVTHGRVAKRLGIARTTVYRHWPTRAHLLFEAFDHGREPVEPVPEGPFADRLRYVLDMFRDRLTRSPLADSTLSVFAEATADPELDDLRVQLSRRLTAPLRDLLECSVTRGELPADLDVGIALAQLVGPINWQRHVLGGPFGPELVDTVAEGFLRLHGLTLPPRSTNEN